MSEHVANVPLSDRITANRLLGTMKDLIYFIEMNPLDVHYSKIFGYDSKQDLKKLEKILLDAGLKETVHPYSHLYEGFKETVGISATIFQKKPGQLSSLKSPFADAYALSLNLNDPIFSLYFGVHEWMIESLVNRYKRISTHYMRKVADFANGIKKAEDESLSKVIYRISQGEPISIADSSLIPLGKSLIHPEKYEDMKVFLRDFNLKTKDIYDTKDIKVENR